MGHTVKVYPTGQHLHPQRTPARLPTRILFITYPVRFKLNGFRWVRLLYRGSRECETG